MHIGRLIKIDLPGRCNNMINSAIKYCKDNKIQFVQSELELEGIKAELIATTEKKLFTTKKNNLYFIECNDLKKIENFCGNLVDDKSIKSNGLALFCKTTLELTEDNTCFIGGGNDVQFVWCVYQNTNSNEYTYFLKDLNMPKTIKKIIKSIVEK